MDKEERKLGTPYLQDEDIIDILADYRSLPFRDQDPQNVNRWIFRIYRFLRPFESEINIDTKRLYSLLDDDFFNKSNWKIEDYDVKKDDVVNKFPYIKELSLEFEKDYKKGKQNLIRLTHKRTEFKYYSSSEESYYQAIGELARLISVYYLWQSKMFNEWSGQNISKDKPTFEFKGYSDKELQDKGIPIDKYKTLIKYFEPKNEFLKKSDDDRLNDLKYITTTPTKGGKGGKTPSLVNRLAKNFKAKDSFYYDEFGDFQITRGYEILKKIFHNSSVGTIAKAVLSLKNRGNKTL